MQISDKEIIHISKLAHLKIDESEMENYKKNLEEIIEFVEIINNVDTTNIEETIATNEKYNVFRKDEIKRETSKEELLANAPSQDEGMFQIPKVIN